MGRLADAPSRHIPLSLQTKQHGLCIGCLSGTTKDGVISNPPKSSLSYEWVLVANCKTEQGFQLSSVRSRHNLLIRPNEPCTIGTPRPMQIIGPPPIFRGSQVHFILFKQHSRGWPGSGRCSIEIGPRFQRETSGERDQRAPGIWSG